MVIKHTRLEYRKGASNKFYEVKMESSSENITVKCRYGRIGSAGNPTIKGLFHSKVSAENMFNKIVSEKINKGYLIIVKPSERRTKRKRPDFSQMSLKTIRNHI